MEVNDKICNYKKRDNQVIAIINKTKGRYKYKHRYVKDVRVTTLNFFVKTSNLVRKIVPVCVIGQGVYPGICPSMAPHSKRVESEEVNVKSTIM